MCKFKLFASDVLIVSITDYFIKIIFLDKNQDFSILALAMFPTNSSLIIFNLTINYVNVVLQKL